MNVLIGINCDARCCPDRELNSYKVLFLFLSIKRILRKLMLFWESAMDLLRFRVVAKSI